jgi:predicted ATPase/DNA-binding CsgD family transcriptional regulator
MSIGQTDGRGPRHPESAAPKPASTSNLPAPFTTLIGREREVAMARQLLQHADVRLLTITGPGGVGKTRLAIQVAVDLLDKYADGVSFVSLAPISDPQLVVPTIAQTLGLREAGNRSFADLLSEYLLDKHHLLLLDNFEQVVKAAPQLVELLLTCSHVKVLVTSRAALHVRAEYEFPLAPLLRPDLKRLPALEALSQYAAIALFVQRARAVKPDFELTEANAPAVAEICARLDGLPLAIELAVARVKLLPPQALLARLAGTGAHKLLAGGPQDLPARQQTLWNTIDWSYHLLGEDEQKLFRRLCIFVGGCTLEAAEAVCQAVSVLTLDVLDGVTSILDKNLLRQREQENGEPRLMFLETIREYGLASLQESGELAAAQDAHATYYLRLSQEAEPGLTTVEQSLWLERLETEHDNLRAALGWFLERAKEGKTEPALRMGRALWRFWLMKGYLSEGRRSLGEVLAATDGIFTSERAKVLSGAGTLAFYQGDYPAVVAFCEESLALCQQLGDKRGMAGALAGLAQVAAVRGSYPEARSMDEEGLAIMRTLGDRWGTANALWHLGNVVWMSGDYLEAQPIFQEALLLFRELGDSHGSAFVLCNLGYVAMIRGDYKEAGTLIDESLAIMKLLGEKRGITRCLIGLGHIAFGQGNYLSAQMLYWEASALLKELGDTWYFVQGVEGLAWTAAAQSHYEQAARLFGAAEVLRETLAIPLLSVYRSTNEHALATTRAGLDAATFAVAWAAGRAMTPAQVLALYQPAPQAEATRPMPASASPVDRYPDELTAREVEVLRLVAQGLSDAQVAEHLVISPHTVHRHLSSIYSKIAVSSRSAATRYAIDHHLA